MTVFVRELTARGAGAVSVLLFSGAETRELVSSLSTNGLPAIGDVLWTRLQIEGEIVDEALLCAPSSCEMELHVHGSLAVVSVIRAYLVSRGVRELRDDASIERSMEERALALVSRAHGESGARILLDQAGGALRLAFAALADAGPTASEAAAALLERARVARFAWEPTRVVIAGPVNAGKSTLFNALVGARRVTVSDVPGTTRDVVRADVSFGAYPVVLADTAGERTTSGESAHAEIERAGQSRALRERGAADWVLWLSPIDAEEGAAPSHAPHDTQTMSIRSCADRIANLGLRSPCVDNAPSISARDDPSAARALVHELFRREFGLPVEPWTPGVAVPFEIEQLRVLEDLRSRGTCAAIGARLRALVGDRGASSSARVAT